MSAGVVAVLGGMNMDLVVRVPRLPAAGDTVIGGDLERHHGGKGANQAVAAARAGATVRMIGAVGRDRDGDELLERIVAEGVCVAHVQRADLPTGNALICVAPDGENQIVVSRGANGGVIGGDITDAVRGVGVVLVSLEVPMQTVAAVVQHARRAGARVVINMAPAMPLPAELLAGSVLVLNERELAVLTGTQDLEEAAAGRLRSVVEALVVTRGARGVTLVTASTARTLTAFQPTHAVDTTGAGDTFCGVVAAWLAAGEPLARAVEAANLAAGLSVRVAGAREGMPYADEIYRGLSS
jgi:ribokinase